MNSANIKIVQNDGTEEYQVNYSDETVFCKCTAYPINSFINKITDKYVITCVCNDLTAIPKTQ